MKQRLVGLAVGLVGAAEAATVAYWPMNLTEESQTRRVLDSSPSQYSLLVRDAALGGVSFRQNDIGWTLPPHADECGVASTQYLASAPGSKDGSNYKQVLTSSNRQLCESMAAHHDFTLEGWARLTALPSGSDKYLFAMNTLAQKGGWAWQFIPTSVANVYTVRVDFNRDGSRTTYDLAATLSGDELLDKWNHFALVRVAAATDTNGEWLFYLNGRLRGQNGKSPVVTDVSFPTSQNFSLSGANSGVAQQVVGDLMCWRASDTALTEGEFLCSVGLSDTVAYWTMRKIDVKGVSIVPDAAGTQIDLSLRQADLGGVAVVENDIGWTEPQNPDPRADHSGVWTSDCALDIEKGVKNPKTGSFQPVLTSANAVLDASLMPTNDFCVEGWYFAKALPESSSRNSMFVFCTYAAYGGWVWNLYGPDAGGKCAVKVIVEAGKRAGSSSDRNTYDLGSIDSTAILNAWNHYALVFNARQNVWKFYFNGVLQGAATGVAIADVPARTPNVAFFGCTSATAQIPEGKITTWRVSRQPFTPARFLCGDMTAANSYRWTGKESSTWSTGGDANWEDDTAAACPWKNHMRAVFDGAASVVVSGEVNPNTIVVTGDEDVSFNLPASCMIGTGCEEIVKEGTGTLLFVGSGVLNKSSNRIFLRGGTLRVRNPNGKSALGNGESDNGYEVHVGNGATLAIEQRNALGESAIDKVNHARITVCTNGVFDLSCPDNFNIQTLSCLNLLGGRFIPPATGHSGGCIQIRDRVTFGKNPGRVPYVFLRATAGIDTQTWQYGTNTEFAVENITEDDEPDVTFDCHVMAMKAWQPATGCCSFRKTGEGTMVLCQEHDGFSTTQVCYPTGAEAVNHIEAGELRIDCDYAGPTFDVASGAFLSGTGCVSSVTFETGAGMKGVLGVSDSLKVTGDCVIRGTGVVSLRTADARRHRVVLATVSGEIAGGENLSSWPVLVDGVRDREYYVVVKEGRLVAKKDGGMLIVVR